MMSKIKLHFVTGVCITGTLAVLAISLVLAESSINTVDDSAHTGRYTSVAAYNGRPVISYYDVDNQDLRVAICLDKTCQERTLELVDSQGDVGQFSSLALNDGQPIISYYDVTNGDLRLSTCLNEKCKKLTQAIVDDSGNVGQYSSLVLHNGLPVIAYYDVTSGNLKLAVCKKSRCNQPDIAIVDQAGDVGQFATMRITNDQPVISYYDATNGNLKLAVCNDLMCATPTHTVVDQAGDVGQYAALALRNGIPVISYYDATNSDLKLVVCNDLMCATPTTTIIDQAGNVGQYTALELYNDRPAISYYDATQQSVKLALCDDPNCTTATISILDSTGEGGLDTDLVVNNHEVFVSYHDASQQSLKLASDVLATGCYLNAPATVNEGDQFTVEIACNQVPQPVFGFQIGHQITAGGQFVTTNDEHFTPGDAFAGQVTLPGPNTLDIYALSLVAGSTEAQGAFTLGSVSYTANEPGEVVFDLANPIFGAINGDEISGILAAQTRATVTINDVFRATVKGTIRPENGLEPVNLGLAGDPLVEDVRVAVDPETGIVEFTYDNIQEPSTALNALAESHTGCVQPLEMQDNALIDLGDQLLLLAGDVTDDNAIDVQDTATISALYGQVPQDDEDINHDGVVDVLDLIYVSHNYDTVGPTTCAQ